MVINDCKGTKKMLKKNVFAEKKGFSIKKVCFVEFFVVNINNFA